MLDFVMLDMRMYEMQYLDITLGTAYKKEYHFLLTTATPAWGFTSQFTLPADCLRLLRILDYESDHLVEGRKILSNSTTMKILYVSRVTDPNEYDELLREVLSAALAADIAYAVTSSNPVAQNMYQLYQEKLKDARFVDATEGNNINPDLGSSSVIDSNTFINSRF
jgi:hypothetical protein